MNRKPFRSRTGVEPPKTSVGKLGMSQAVSTFGVGSIYEMRSMGSSSDLVLHSVMVAGLHIWPSDHSSILREPSLANALGITEFRRPPAETGKKSIPAVRFPGLHYCSKEDCGRVGFVGKEFSDALKRGVRCNKNGCSGKGVPFRFVVACHDKTDPAQPGHIGDFPYKWWTHEGESCSDPAIVLNGSSEKSGLEGLLLRCLNCKKSQSLARIFSEGSLAKRSCRGHRPWLGDSEPGCTRQLRVLQRGASNVYFPVTASALSIPPFSNQLNSLLLDVVPQGAIKRIQQGDHSGLDNAVVDIRNTPGLDDPEEFTDQQIRDGILIIAGVHNANFAKTEAEQKLLERNALIVGQTDENSGDFVAFPTDFIPEKSSLRGLIGSLVQVHRLREVRALRGFQRVEPTFDGDPYQLQCAPLSKAKESWLPAIEVRGEGIYFELDLNAVGKWEDSIPVQNRIHLIRQNYEKACMNAGRSHDHPPSAKSILVHTLSHMMMKQLSLECGYSGSSLRERLYVSDYGASETCAGFLIYTASSSADGTLGGLVSQGDPSVFEGMLCSAIQAARWCSSDPLCIESDGQGTDALNLAACHACALIAETSCERRNMFLDRGLVVGTLANPEIGFFAKLISELDSDS